MEWNLTHVYNGQVGSRAACSLHQLLANPQHSIIIDFYVAKMVVAISGNVSAHHPLEAEMLFLQKGLPRPFVKAEILLPQCGMRPVPSGLSTHLT